MNRWEKMTPPGGYPEAPVVPWPVGGPAPALPPGMAGVSVRVRTRGSDPATWLQLKAVGVDDRPMWRGYGRMVTVVEPGEHLVEVRGPGSAESVRRVSVRPGEVAELEYFMPASYGTVEGMLARPPVRRRPGPGAWVFVLPLLATSSFPLLPGKLSPPVAAAAAAGLIAGLVGLTLLVSRGKRAIDRRRRVAASYESTGDVRDADRGMFLGDGEPPAGLTDAGRGALVVTGVSAQEYRWNGLGVVSEPAEDPNSWIPWPVLSIDGERRPFSWRTWAYRLPPGEHEVTVEMRAPGGAEVAAPEPVRVPVRIVAGQVTRLDLRVNTRTEVHSTKRGARVPTQVTRFTATVEPKVR
ncbi:hypothetical protein ONA91_22580 [Micromonospora sp. DR5-3]|uniref:hypothetical protein n=1 Tax=unclassified Micromonospora TaxID=2617518 RepID=UPI0011D8FA05|nr:MULTISPECIES: hypothetical protein [unclassified Micromonospora]MCW3817243.1 hypothetical protein [Micromonospora sp. DR5-3]TYC26247.1 hypothetical protein FXF52_02540 [Micromonospora sp. MP36]